MAKHKVIINIGLLHRVQVQLDHSCALESPAGVKGVVQSHSTNLVDSSQCTPCAATDDVVHDQQASRNLHSRTPYPTYKIAHPHHMQMLTLVIGLGGSMPLTQAAPQLSASLEYLRSRHFKIMSTKGLSYSQQLLPSQNL